MNMSKTDCPLADVFMDCCICNSAAQARGCSMEQAHLSHRMAALSALGMSTWCGGNGHTMGSAAGLLVRVLLGDRRGSFSLFSLSLCLCFPYNARNMQGVHVFSGRGGQERGAGKCTHCTCAFTWLLYFFIVWCMHPFIYLLSYLCTFFIHVPCASISSFT